jgi:hypothetical protein
MKTDGQSDASEGGHFILAWENRNLVTIPSSTHASRWVVVPRAASSGSLSFQRHKQDENMRIVPRL